MKNKRKALDTDDLIDRFVEIISSLPRERGFEDAIPPSVRGEPDDPESWCVSFDWSIRPWPNIDWIEPMERRMDVMLPPSFRSLVTRYVFPRFEVDALRLEANTPEGVPGEFRHLDPSFEKVLVPRGYIPFARPVTGSYDPICFDTRRQRGGGECAVVRIEHESVLSHGVIGEMEDVVPSFATLVTEFVRSHSA